MANQWEISDYQEQRENPTNFWKKKTQRLQNQNGTGCVNLLNMHFRLYVSYFDPTFLGICAGSGGSLDDKVCHISRIAKM